MFTFQWQEELTTGNRLLDEEHRELFRRLGEMFMTIRDRRDGVEADSLNYLRNFVTTHFRREEARMKAAGYQNLSAHAQDHARIAELVEDICRAAGECTAVDMDVLALTNRMLANLLLQHTCSFDAAFAETVADEPRSGRAPSGSGDDMGSHGGA